LEWRERHIADADAWRLLAVTRRFVIAKQTEMREIMPPVNGPSLRVKGRMAGFSKLFSTRTLALIAIVLPTVVAVKALSVLYDFSWAVALAKE
jgi:hypothetical protein